MPELPEVETIKRELKPLIINRRIIGCEVLRKDIIGYPALNEFPQLLIGETILDIQRRAKYLIFVLSNDKRLLFHLRLSGAIIVKNCNAENNRFTRLVIRLDNCQINFDEPRALGRVYCLKNNEQPGVLKGFFKLSYEPISPEYDFLYFKNKIAGRHAMIKSLLLDQRLCAGVGNIYSDEALFHAGIRPTRKANSLKTEELFSLLIALKKVLRTGIDEFGTTVSDYKRTDGKSGNFQKFLFVYDREGKTCKICGRTIALVKIGNRSTRYCPGCQK
ncbi:MAG: bifunctional DNA-formamidopyrimidine glycosylase/DNA-(apurinic or apyrimidinic site) lyase [bacterium]